MADALQLARLTSDNARREWRVSIGAPRDYALLLTFQAGEPVELPIGATLTTALTGATVSSIEVSSTTGYADAGTVIVNPGSAGAGWYAYTGKDADTFTGVTYLHGAMSHAIGSPVTAWATLGYYPPLPASPNQRLSAEPVIREYREGQFYVWDAEIEGVYFDRRLLKDDATVLIEHRVSPNGNAQAFTRWLPAALGYVRHWDVTIDSTGNRRWRGRVECVKTYLDMTRFPARRYGRVNLLEGASITASGELANPEDELQEFQGGLGTTAADNAVDNSNNTLYISQLAPTSTAEAAGSSGGADPGVQIEEVFNGDAQTPGLEWIMLRLAADSPNYNEQGVNLHNFAITNKQTDFRESAEDDFPNELQHGAAQFYIRTRNITLNEANDIVILANNGALFRSRYNVASRVQVVDWRFLDGFGDDQEPARNFTLASSDWLQLRAARGKEKVVSMVVWGTHTGTPWWNNAADEDESGGEWTPSDAVVWATANTSLRRFPVSLNTRGAADWIEEIDPNPADRRTDTDQLHWSAEIPPFVVNLTANITDNNPDDGGALVLTDATWFDLSGTVKIDAEEINYAWRDATTLYGITRGANGTAADSHASSALVYAVGTWEVIEQSLATYMSATSPATGADLFLSDTGELDAAGTIRIDNEVITYTSKTADSIENITRGANGTTATTHTQRALIWKKDNASLGATRQPLADEIEWRRWLRLDANGRNIVPERFEIYGSVNTDPLYPGDDDWRLDWLDGQPLISVVGNGRLTWARGLPKPMRLQHILIYCKKMSDNGRFKLNEVILWRKQNALGAGSNERGAGIVVRDALERVMLPYEVRIEAGAFDHTSADMTIAEGSVSEVLEDLLAETFTVCKCECDGTVSVFRDPFHPLGRRVEVRAVMTAAAMRSPMSATYPSRIGAERVIVEIWDAKTGEVVEGAYPPNAGAFTSQRYVLRRAGVTSQEAANDAAARLYLMQENISRMFQFTTTGVAEWLTVGDRLLVTDYSDDARPDGQLINTLVVAVTHGVDGAEEVTAQEWRAL